MEWWDYIVYALFIILTIISWWSRIKWNTSTRDSKDAEIKILETRLKLSKDSKNETIESLREQLKQCQQLGAPEMHKQVEAYKKMYRDLSLMFTDKVNQLVTQLEESEVKTREEKNKKTWLAITAKKVFAENVTLVKALEATKDSKDVSQYGLITAASDHIVELTSSIDLAEFEDSLESINKLGKFVSKSSQFLKDAFDLGEWRVSVPQSEEGLKSNRNTV